MSTALVDKGINWFANDRFADRGLQQTKDASMTGLPGKSANPELLNSLNKASQTERDKNKQGPGVDPSTLAQNGPGLKTPGTGSDAAIQAAAAGKNINGAVGPTDKNDAKLDPATGKPLNSPGNATTTTSSTTVPVPPNKKDTPGLKPGGVLTAAGLAGLAGAAAAGMDGNGKPAVGESGTGHG